MKGIILCGGMGTRLRPLTYSDAKQLLPVANKPVIFYMINLMKEVGIKEIGIVVGDNYREFKNRLGNGSELGVSLSYIRQDKPLGLAHAVKTAETYIGNRPFVAALGDNIITHSLEDIIVRFEESLAVCTLLLSTVDKPQRYGIAKIEGCMIKGLYEKPMKPMGNKGILGIYAFSSKIFNAINRIVPSDRGELEITDAIMEMIKDGCQVNYIINRGWWKDIGEPEDLLAANMEMISAVNMDIKGMVDENSIIEGNVVLAEEASVINSILRGPLIIGRGAYVKDAYIGPYTSIGEQSRMIGCEIENSIVMERCVIQNIDKRMDKSIIGAGSILKEKIMPMALSVWIARDSRMEI